MNQKAKNGTVFVCACCSKRSYDKYGLEPIDPGWDESCMLHAVLCYNPPKYDEQGEPQWIVVEEPEYFLS